MSWQAWQTRVVGRSMTGTWKASDIWKANPVISRASAGEEGSSTGTLACTAIRRESCSVWEEWGPGSSALITTKPPTVPR